MTDYYSNVYNSPEKFNLKIVKDFGEGGGYDWSTMVVWADEFGNLFYASDSGCSCNSPFEDTRKTDDLTHYEEGAFYKALMAWAEGEGKDYCTMSNVIEGLQDVRRIAKEKTVKFVPDGPGTKVITEVVDRQWEYRIHASQPPHLDAIDVYIVRYDLTSKLSQFATASQQGEVGWTTYPEGTEIMPVIRIGGQAQTRLSLNNLDDVKALVKRLKEIPA